MTIDSTISPEAIRAQLKRLLGHPDFKTVAAKLLLIGRYVKVAELAEKTIAGLRKAGLEEI